MIETIIFWILVVLGIFVGFAVLFFVALLMIPLGFAANALLWKELRNYHGIDIGLFFEFREEIVSKSLEISSIVSKSNAQDRFIILWENFYALSRKRRYIMTEKTYKFYHIFLCTKHNILYFWLAITEPIIIKISAINLIVVQITEAAKTIAQHIKHPDIAIDNRGNPYVEIINKYDLSDVKQLAE